MKLIEAETAKEMLKRVIFGADQKIDSWVDAMPEVDVIPVEWIKEQADDAPNQVMQAAIDYLLIVWEKEQEAKS